MPTVGSIVQVPDGKGKVIEINPLLEQAKVELQDKNVKLYEREDIKVLQEAKKCNGCGARDEKLDAETLRELKKLED